MPYLFLLLLLFSSASLKAARPCFQHVSWSECTTQDGIKVCSGNYQNHQLKAFFGTTVLDASMQELVSILYDVQHYPLWQINLEKIDIIEETIPLGLQACHIARIEHSFGKKPWFVSWAFWVPDSEFIYSADYQLSDDAERFALTLHNYALPKITQTNGYQRGKVESCYFLEQAQDSEKTHITVELWVDLNLDVAAERINKNLRQWPTDIIQGLRQQITLHSPAIDKGNAKHFIEQCLGTNTPHALR